MTHINCLHARKHWKEASKYLERIQFISIETDEETKEKYISLLADEEGNYDIKLDGESAEWLIRALTEGVISYEEKMKTNMEIHREKKMKTNEFLIYLVNNWFEVRQTLSKEDFHMMKEIVSYAKENYLEVKK